MGRNTAEWPVVVGVDDSPSARDAARWGAEVAVARAVPLHLVHLAATAEVPPWLVHLADAVGGTAQVVQGAAEPDAVAAELRVRAETAGLVVVGGYGEGSDAGLLAGTVAACLAGGAPCPVAVVHGPGPDTAPQSAGPVVVGVDAVACTALDVAADLAHDLGAPLLLIHAWSDVVAGPTGGAHRRPEDWTELAARGEAVAAEALRRVRARRPAVAVAARSVEGTALSALLDLAPTARMIVVTPRRTAHPPRHGDGMLLGSTSRGLIGFAACPVVLAAPEGP
jgi:nucleotide-binding universal stress UspA family protein